AIASVHHKQRLTPSRAIGREQILIDEDVALVNGRMIGRVQQWKVADLAVEQRRLFHLHGSQSRAQLRLIGTHLADHACYCYLGLASGNVELEAQVGGSSTG